LASWHDALHVISLWKTPNLQEYDEQRGLHKGHRKALLDNE